MADETETKVDQSVKYTVYASNIKDDAGKKRRHGEIAKLSPKLARHYNKLGYLRPYIPDADDDADEVVNDGTAPTPQRASESTPSPRANRSTAKAL